ncbi:MAG: hypothetical protein NTU94_15020 [Planctomycetota bacterium]|nr:hypothetical protein [Planctomycetota bacterium]
MRLPGFFAGPAVFVVKDVPSGDTMTVGMPVSMALPAVGQACCWRSRRTTIRPSGLAASASAIQASASAWV